MRTPNTGEFHRPTFRRKDISIKEYISFALAELLRERSRNRQPVIRSREKSMDTNASVRVYAPLNPWRSPLGEIIERVPYKLSSSEHEATSAVSARP